MAIDVILKELVDISNREMDIDERIKKNGRLISLLPIALKQYDESISKESITRREGNVILFVPSYAQKGGK